jgi:hypothetical protein
MEEEREREERGSYKAKRADPPVNNGMKIRRLAQTFSSRW